MNTKIIKKEISRCKGMKLSLWITGIISMVFFVLAAKFGIKPYHP